MKNRIQYLLALALFAFGFSGMAADFKIATVDLRKAYYTYYKTVLAMQAESNNVAERDKQLNQMIDESKKREDDWRQAVAKANDQSISAERRAEYKKSVDEITFDLQVRNESISNFYAKSEIERHDKMVQHVTDLTTEILGVMNAMAKKQGFTLVLDRTAVTMTGYPLVLYTSGENDLTDSLIKELNSTAAALPPPDTNIPPAILPPSGMGIRPPPTTPAPR